MIYFSIHNALSILFFIPDDNPLKLSIYFFSLLSSNGNDGLLIVWNLKTDYVLN